MRHKTAIATAASVSGVLLASVAALGANVGILRTNDDNFGELSASGDSSAEPTSTTASTLVDTAVIDTVLVDTVLVDTVLVDGSANSSSGAPAGTTVYQVPGIADITIARSGDGGLQVLAVVPAAGWTHSSHISSDGIEVELTGSTERIEFKASVVDGQVTASIERSAVGAVDSERTVATNATTRSSDDDDDEHEGGDDDD